MNLSRCRLLQIILILEIVTVSSGFYLYMQGPTSFLTSLTLSKTEDLFFYPRIGANCSLGFAPAYKKFIVNMTVSADLNFTGPGLEVFLLNRTQFENWNGSNVGFTLKREYPDYNFSAKVEPDEYYLALRGNLSEGRAVSCIHQAKAVLQDFDYGRVWPFFCLTLAGIIAMNINIGLMKKEKMFVRLDMFIEKMCRPWTELPKKSLKGYMTYQANSYRRFFRPLLSFCTQYLPIFLMICVFLMYYVRIAGRNILFADVMWDFVFISTITSYPFLLLIICGCILMALFTTFRARDLEFAISKRLGILKNAYVDESSQIGSLIVDILREKKVIAIVSAPVVLLVGVLLAFQGYLFRFEQIELTPLLWALIGMLLAYYGLIFAYQNSKIMRQTLGHARRAQIDVYRKNMLLEGLVSSTCSVLSFVLIVSFFIIILEYGWLPILSSSLAVKYGLIIFQTVNLGSLFFLLMKVVLLAYLLYTLIFTGISGYLVPTLIERGVKGPVVAFTALILTFLTDRLLSFVLKPFVDTDLVISLFPSFAVFVSVLVFEKFYKRILGPYEETA